MRRLSILFLALCWMVAACGSSTTDYSYTDAIIGNDVPEGEDVPEVGDDTTEGRDTYNEPGMGLLEFFDEFGDDAKQCQGFSDAPTNKHKIDQCNFVIGFNQTRTLKVIYMEDGQPVASQNIKWELVNVDGDVATLDATNTPTEANGVATVTLKSKQEIDQFAVKASAIGTKIDVPPLYFNIVVDPKVEVPLTVKFEHTGGAMFTKVKAFVFLQENNKPACSDILVNDMPTAYKASAPMSIDATAQFKDFTELTATNPLQLTVVAVGYDENGPYEAYGCNDVDGYLELGIPTTMTVILDDLPPSYAGKYDVVNHFDLISALPDNVEQVVNYIIDLFNNPAAAILEMACDLSNGALVDFCQVIFNDPNNPSIDNVTVIGGFVTDLINAFLISLLEDNIGGDILFTGKDVSNILKDLEIHSVLWLKEEPDEDGLFYADDTEVNWKTISFQWTLGEECDWQDEDCGLKSFSFSQIQQDVILGKFDASIPGYKEGQFDKLVINQHSLNFKYGTLLNYIIEKVLLPIIGGDGSDGLPVVDTYEKFIWSLLGGKECLVAGDCCTVFADGASEDSWVNPVLKTGCNTLVPLVAGYLRTWLTGLDAQTGEAFTMATKEPCQLYDNTGNHQIDGLGKKEPKNLRCIWDVKLHVNDTDVYFDSDFYGVRQN